MSVKQSSNLLSNMRIDVPHLRAFDSSVLFDFKSLLQAFVGESTPYILRGFDVNNAGAAINGNASNLQIIVDQATIWMPSEADGSFLRVPSGTANETLNSANAKVTGSFTANAINYVSVKFTRATDSSTNDLVAFWDVDAGVEFTKTVPLGLVLNYQFVINTSGFDSNSPVAIITTDASNNVIKIDNPKNNMFRLGKGGASANASYNWAYSQATENPLTLSSSGGPSPYAGGDWELKTWKDWMDAVMTEIKAVKGSAYWYSAGSTLIPSANISDLYWDTAASVVTGRGKYVHSDVTPGLFTWTSDVYIKSIFGNLTLTVNAGNVTLADGEVAYIDLIRNQDFQPSNTFSFVNGSNTVTATANISGISAGDWIKFEAHNFSTWANVNNLSGSTLILSSNYTGPTATGKALRTAGSYTMQSASPTAIPVSSNTYWFAKRDDNAFSALTVNTIGFSGLQRTSNISTVKCTTSHGLVSGQAITITGASDPSFDGFFDIITTDISGTEFTIYNPGADVGPTAAGGGSISATPKLYLRGGAGPGELEQGESVQIDDETNLNILQFIGAVNETDTTPPYTIVPNGLAPYTFTSANNLTEAISALAGDVNDVFTTLDKPAYDEPLVVVASGSVNVSQSLFGSSLHNLTSNFSSDDYYGQSFTTPNAGNLLNITFKLTRSATPHTDGNLYAAVYAQVPNSTPFGSPLAVSDPVAMTSLTVTSPADVAFTFSSPAALSNATVYYIAVYMVGVTTGFGKAVLFYGTTPSNYSGGSALGGLITSVVPQPTEDLYFSLNMTGGGVNDNQIVGPVSAGTTITLPLHSRNGDIVQSYIVGKGYLQVYLNGQMLQLTESPFNIGLGWTEVGAALSASNQIVINQDLAIDDVLTFRIGGVGGPGSGTGAPDDDFNTLTSSVTADNADKVLIYDNSAGGYRRQTRAVFLSGLGGNLNVTTKTANYTADATNDDVILVNTTGGNVTITLPAASTRTKPYYIKNIGTGAFAMTVDGNGSETIDNALTATTSTPMVSYTLVSDGVSKWWQV